MSVNRSVGRSRRGESKRKATALICISLFLGFIPPQVRGIAYLLLHVHQSDPGETENKEVARVFNLLIEVRRKLLPTDNQTLSFLSLTATVFCFPTHSTSTNFY